MNIECIIIGSSLTTPMHAAFCNSMVRVCMLQTVLLFSWTLINKLRKLLAEYEYFCLCNTLWDSSVIDNMHHHNYY